MLLYGSRDNSPKKRLAQQPAFFFALISGMKGLFYREVISPRFAAGSAILSLAVETLQQNRTEGGGLHVR